MPDYYRINLDPQGHGAKALAAGHGIWPRAL